MDNDLDPLAIFEDAHALDALCHTLDQFEGRVDDVIAQLCRLEGQLRGSARESTALQEHNSAAQVSIIAIRTLLWCGTNLL
ncbi:hypothetical protein KIPB_017174 [Kipferlia bialata]|uniref:Uncharacterized protein n=1 Tax=Kipferlia bialata TaxID=797122 RepID=A0A391P754_9EUKA|nr:hypothetical protein KIPB_017174 [Kipferlia bialata]|eukprot:g17174.t1